MSIDNITGKILAEAENQRELILKEAEQKSRKIIEEAERQAEIIKKRSEEKAKEDTMLIKSRRISVAELEVRKIRLGAKQEQIAHCFDLALGRIASMDESDYLQLLATSIHKIGGNGGELLLNKKDRESIGEKLIDKINKSGEIEGLSLSEDMIDAKGGFVLRRGSVEINSTLETMVNGIRESVIPDVVKALYG